MKKNKKIKFDNGAKVIAICNQKGGVGKTTLSVNLAYALSQMGRKVLLIDFDSQASASAMLNIDTESEAFYGSIYELSHYILDGQTFSDFDDDKELTFSKLCESCITRPTFMDPEWYFDEKTGKKKFREAETEFGFDLIPSKIELSDFELELSAGKASAFYLLKVVQKIQSEYKKYDYILIDCNPSIGLLTVNAMTAATAGVLITCNMSLLALRGIQQLTDRVVDLQEVLKERVNIIHMGVLGIALNNFNPRGVVDRDIKVDATEFLPFKVFESVIPKSSEAEKALFSGVLYSQRLKKAYDAYVSLAEEIENKIVEMEEKGAQIVRMGELGEEDE